MHPTEGSRRPAIPAAAVRPHSRPVNTKRDHLIIIRRSGWSIELLTSESVLCLNDPMVRLFSLANIRRGVCEEPSLEPSFLSMANVGSLRFNEMCTHLPTRDLQVVNENLTRIQIIQ